MKKMLLISGLFFLAAELAAQVSLPVYHDSLFSTYYHQRATLFRLLPQSPDDIIMMGNSITDGGEWSDMFNDRRMKDRGISGDISAGILHRLKDVVKGKPKKIFLMIGTNDLARNITPDSVVRNIFLAADYLRQEIPATELYVQSILPVNDYHKKFSNHTSKGESIRWVNRQLEQGAGLHHYTYIDLHTPFSDSEGKLDIKYSNDGLHLMGEGYFLWKEKIMPFILGK